MPGIMRISVVHRIRGETHEFSSVSFPSSNLLATHCKVDRIDLDTVSCWIPWLVLVLLYQALVVITIRILV